MARTVRDTRLESRSARSILPIAAEPRWKAIDAGLAIGYRRNKRGGAWLARRYDSEARRYREAAIGRADDAQDADGATVLNFSQAQAAARAWWNREERGEGVEDHQRGPYTVADAISEYLAARERKGSRGVYSDRRYAETRIVPALGTLPLAKLATPRLRRWLEDLATEKRLVRTKPGAATRAVRPIDLDDAEVVRARRATANRVLTILKAALNRAFQDGKIGSDVTWRRVKPFREVDAAVVRYLDAPAIIRLVNACSEDFGALVRGALLTGCRYGELVRMTGADYNVDAGTVAVRRSKSGKARHVVLTTEGQRFFAGLANERDGRALLFQRADGKPWGSSHQQRPLEVASRVAKIEPAVTFHILRHSYASAAVMRGISLEVIAEQLGHADTRITKKHYAHLAPSYVAQAIRAGLPELGLA